MREKTRPQNHILTWHAWIVQSTSHTCSFISVAEICNSICFTNYCGKQWDNASGNPSMLNQGLSNWVTLHSYLFIPREVSTYSLFICIRQRTTEQSVYYKNSMPQLPCEALRRKAEPFEHIKTLRWQALKHIDTCRALKEFPICCDQVNPALPSKHPSCPCTLLLPLPWTIHLFPSTAIPTTFQHQKDLLGHRASDLVQDRQSGCTS